MIAAIYARKSTEQHGEGPGDLRAVCAELGRQRRQEGAHVPFDTSVGAELHTEPRCGDNLHDRTPEHCGHAAVRDREFHRVPEIRRTATVHVTAAEADVIEPTRHERAGSVPLNLQGNDATKESSPFEFQWHGHIAEAGLYQQTGPPCGDPDMTKPAPRAPLDRFGLTSSARRGAV